MKTGLDFASLTQELDRQQRAKRDFLTPASVLQFAPTTQTSIHNSMTQRSEPSPNQYKLAFPYTGSENEELKITNDLVHTQIASHAKIDKRFYDYLRKNDPEALAWNVNRRWTRERNSQRMVRVLDGKIRAFLSDRYRRLENADLVAAVTPIIEQHGAVVHSCAVTDTKLYLKAVMDDVEAVIPPKGMEGVSLAEARARNVRGHHLYARINPAIIIGNSEVGAGSLFVQFGIHTVECTNLASWNGNLFQKSHLGRMQKATDTAEEFLSTETQMLEDAALFARVRDVATAALDGRIFEKHVAQLRHARGLEVPREVSREVIEITGDRVGLTVAEREDVYGHFLESGDNTAYGIHSAVTRASQDVQSYDRATELETAGGDVIELAQGDWTAIIHEAQRLAA